MAREINKLSPRKAQTTQHPGLHSDGNSLYLAVSPSGSKSWRYIYRWRGRRIELGLGPYPTISLAEARETARNFAALRARGINPKSFRDGERREAEATAPTFGEVALQFIETKQAGWKNEKHRAQWRSTLETYASSIWNSPVNEVCVDDVVSILRPIWTTKPETASRLRGRIENVLNAAKVRGLRSGENPAAWRGNLALILPPQHKGPKRHHPAMPYDVLPGFMKRLRTANGIAARALELLIHTAARTSEVIEARWSEFDLEGKLWTVPADRMKAGKVHRVPLTHPVVELLRSLPHQSEFVFPGGKIGKPLSNMAMTNVLKRLGVENVTVHGFRSSFRDFAADVAHAPREIAEQALAHQVGSAVERAYRRGDALERRRELMEAWSAYVLAVSST